MRTRKLAKLALTQTDDQFLNSVKGGERSLYFLLNHQHETVRKKVEFAFMNMDRSVAAATLAKRLRRELRFVAFANGSRLIRLARGLTMLAELDPAEAAQMTQFASRSRSSHVRLAAAILSGSQQPSEIREILAQSVAQQINAQECTRTFSTFFCLGCFMTPLVVGLAMSIVVALLVLFMRNPTFIDSDWLSPIFIISSLTIYLVILYLIHLKALKNDDALDDQLAELKSINNGASLLAILSLVRDGKYTRKRLDVLDQCLETEYFCPSIKLRQQDLRTLQALFDHRTFPEMTSRFKVNAIRIMGEHGDEQTLQMLKAICINQTRHDFQIREAAQRAFSKLAARLPKLQAERLLLRAGGTEPAKDLLRAAEPGEHDPTENLLRAAEESAESKPRDME